MNANWRIRKTAVSDLDGILEIEKASFMAPWSRRAFESELVRPGGISLTAEVDFRPIGYAMGWFVTDELHIANLAVHPEWRRQGVGESLLNALFDASSDAVWAGLEVRQSNAAAIALYQKSGFVKTGLRKKYYTDEGEDAVLMEKSLDQTKRGTHGMV